MLHLEPRHLEIVHAILSKYPYDFYAFGSRVVGGYRRLSDLDLCYMIDIPHSVIAHIEEDFVQSDLPFKVDLLNWQKANPSFKELIKKDLYSFQFKKSILSKQIK